MFRCLVCVLAFIVSVSATEKTFQMIELGEVLFSSDFTNSQNLTKETFNTRKETFHSLKDGKLKLLPPKIGYKGNPPEKSKWAEATMSRMTFNNFVPQDYAVSFRFMVHEPEQDKAKKKVSFFFEFGHRYLRLEMKTEGTKLLIMNRLSEEYITLDQKADFKIVPGKWYDVYAELKGPAAIVQVNDKTFYGKHELLTKTRPPVLQLNNAGAGFDLDHVKFWKAGAFKESWSEKQKQLLK